MNNINCNLINNSINNFKQSLSEQYKLRLITTLKNLYLNNITYTNYINYIKVVYTNTFYIYIKYDLFYIYTLYSEVKSRQSDYYNSCVKKFLKPLHIKKKFFF
jgi:hypothetical protein